MAEAAASAPVAELPLEQRFVAWVSAFRATALAQGISEATLQAAFDGVQYLPRVVELDRAQPEFTRPVWQYLDSAGVTAARGARPATSCSRCAREAEDAAARYGVPAPTLVAIWGIESNYGDNYGSTPTIDALATLGFDGRREAWARSQLLAALKILQNGDIARAQMIGSWAGAMGQTQFLPSNFLAYAVDADGDGRRDIWGSVADVMASTAQLPAARSAGKPSQPWGVEVQLPPGFDLGRADGEPAPVERTVGRRGRAHVERCADARARRRRDPAAGRCARAGVSGRAELPHHPALQQLDQLRARGQPAGAAHRRRPGRAGRLAARVAAAVAQPGDRAANRAQRARLRQRHARRRRRARPRATRCAATSAASARRPTAFRRSSCCSACRRPEPA